MIICLLHQAYRGIQKPDLTCRNCCRIFIERMKNSAAQQTQRLVQKKTPSKQTGAH